MHQKPIEVYPLSYSQKSIWLSSNFIQQKDLYHLAAKITFTIALDPEIIKKAVYDIINTHPQLRAHFSLQNGEPVQLIHPEADKIFTMEKADNVTEEELEKKIQHVVSLPFDLEKGPLIRIHLFCCSTSKYIFIGCIHHIITDGWACGLIYNEIINRVLVSIGQSPDMIPVSQFTYKDYIDKQNDILKGSKGENLFDYWKRELGNQIEPVKFPFRIKKDTSCLWEGEVQRFTLPGELFSIKNYTPFSILLSIISLFFYRLTAQKIIYIAIPMLNRMNKDFMNVIGNFENTVIIKTDFTTPLNFLELLSQVNDKIKNAQLHQTYPLYLLKEKLKIQSNPLTPMLTNVYVSHAKLKNNLYSKPRMDDIHQKEHENKMIDINPIELFNVPADFGIQFYEINKEKSYELLYNTNIFTREIIVKLISMIKTIVQSIIENPEINVDDVNILTPGEKKYLFNIGYKAVPLHYNLDFASIFENQVKKTPDNKAIQYNATSITYQELNIRANQLAHYLLEKGIKKEERIAVYQPPSPDIIIALLAIMKTGATYIPLSPHIPENRLHHILDDSETKTVIISGGMVFLSRYSKNINIIDMKKMSAAFDAYTGENCIHHIPLSSPAYIIYTSGTTGNPKGVIIEQKGIGNLFQAQLSNLKLHDSERILQFAEIDFDASIWEIIMALFSGNTLVMCDEEIRKDPEKLRELLNKEKITLATLPPIMLSHLSTDIPSLKKIVSAGESCSIDIVKKWCKDERYLFNAYGPTEGTVCSTIGELHVTDKRITIGKPIHNVEITILDDNLRLVPQHITGEICISGINLARGYIHPEKISPYPFIKHPDPISSNPKKNHPLLYKTGDLGRWDEDGTIEFLGRKDRQIKLHGYRIELAEIESVLNNIEGVIDSLVLLRNDESPTLVAFVQSDTNKINQDIIIRQLKKILPSYMIPGFIIFLDNWPLTPHKKKDPDKLYEMITQTTMPGYKHKIFPRNPIEETILEIWRDVLHMDEISIDDNFFELGGHSLQMTRVVSRMKVQLSIDIPLHILFENPTIMALSGQVEDFRNTLTSTLPMPCVIKNKGDVIPLSPSQERMWFVHQLEPESIAYNILVAIRLKKKVNPEILRQCFREIIRRHDILRTVFVVKDGNPVQIVRKEIHNYFNIIDISGLSKDDRELKRHTVQNEEARFLFNLKEGPLIRITIIKVSDEELISILHMHHIISDQWSVGNIANELNILYKSHLEGIELKLPVLPLQYSDYSLWQQKYFIDDNLQRDINYWKEQLKDLPVLTLPQDKTRPLTQTYAGANIIIPLDDSIIERIKMLNTEYHSTTFMFLLTIFYILVYRYTGMKDIPIGVPNANRSFSSIENLIGTFVNTLVIRVAIDDDLFFKDLLKRVKQISLDAFAHKDLPFNKLVEIMNLERDSSHLPLVQIFFNIANAPVTDNILDEFSWEIVELDEIGVQFDLTLTIELTKLKQIIFSYNKDLFQGESIQQMANHYHTLILDVLDNPEHVISKIPLINDYEKKQMFYKWNDTVLPYPKDSTFSEIFEQVVQQRSTSKTIFFDTISITLKELNRQANKVAHYLKSRGVGPETIIGIHIHRSINLLIGLLGIMKAGGVFLPLDPEYPKERLLYMAEDSKASYLLLEKSLHDQFPILTGKIICIDDILEEKKRGVYHNLKQSACSENTVYIIYTSGSTGKPKGVQISHRSLLNFLFSMKEKPGMNDHDHLLALTPFSFDIAYLELFLPLLTGGKMTLAGTSERQDGFLLKELIEKIKPTIVQATPSTWQMLLDAGWNNHIINKLLCGGEALPQELSHKLFLRSNELWNMYGPTETTIWSTIYKIPYEKASVLLGKPIANTQIFIFDAYENPVPIGVAGELHIGGDGLAKGYIFQKEYTREKFKTVTLDNGEKARLYKTGDIACYKRDGNIEFIGRKDAQVKYHGYRIELGEIDYWISQIPLISQTISVMHTSESGEQRIISYIVLKNASGRENINDHIIEFLKERVPHYMIPSFIISMEAFPLTPNKKIDKNKLPPPLFHEDQNIHFELPADDIEIKLLSTWNKVLGINKISMTDNFFNLGGHSLLAVRLISELNKSFNLTIPLRLLFSEPTPKGLARKIRNHLFLNDPHAINVVDGDILFRLQEGKPRIPLFIIVGMPGDENEIYRYFTNLIPYLESNLPVYGLRPKGLLKPADAYKTVSEIAADYIREIRKIQPNGPYFIAGECIGGIIAYETAQQLIASGEHVGRLILLDTFYPSGQTKQELSVIIVQKILEKFRNRFTKLLTIPLHVFYKLALDYLKKQIQKHIFKDKIYRNDNRFERVKMNYYLLAQNYKPKPYSAEITIIVNEKDYRKNPFLDWQKLYETGNMDKSLCDIRPVHGDHKSRLTLYGKETGSIINEIINKLD